MMKFYVLLALYYCSSSGMSLKTSSNNPPLTSSQILYQKALMDVETLRRQRSLQPPRSLLMETPAVTAPCRVEESNENEVAFVVCGLPLCKLFRVFTQNYHVEPVVPESTGVAQKNY